MKTELQESVIFQKKTATIPANKNQTVARGTDHIFATAAVQGSAILLLFPNDGLIDCFCIPAPCVLQHVS